MDKRVLLALGVLTVLVAVFAYLNMDNLGDRMQAQREAEMYLEMGGEEVATLDFDIIQNLSEREFTETLRSSDGSEENHTYTGVPLKEIIDHYELSLDEVENIVTEAADGYAVALTVDEVRQEDNVYIVYKKDGEYLATREDGGAGPYQLVIREDEFGQRWNKYLMRITIE